MSKKYNFNDRVHFGKDFLRFLETEKVNINGMTREQIKPVYYGTYKVYRKTILPNEGIPGITSVLNALMKINTLFCHKDTQKVYIHGSPESRNLMIEMMSAYLEASDEEEEERSGDSSAAGFLGPGGRGRAAPGVGAKPQSTYSQMAATSRAQGEALVSTAATGTGTGATSTDSQAGDSAEDGEMPTCIKMTGRLSYCTLCKTKCTSRSDTLVHLKGRRHRLATILNNLKTQRRYLIQDKGELQVTCPGHTPTVKGEFVLEMMESIMVTIDFVVTNVSKKNTVKVIGCEMLKKIRVFRLHDERYMADYQGELVLKPGESYTFHLQACADNVGTYVTNIAFSFINYDDPSTLHHIVRVVFGMCSNDVVTSLVGKEPRPYKKKRQLGVYLHRNPQYVPGTKPPTSNRDALPKEVPLKPYNFELTLVKYANRNLVETRGLNTGQTIEMNSLRKLLEEPADMETYTRRFHTLLHFEEIQMAVDIQNYDMESSIGMSPQSPHLFTVTVPGLAENRPSVLRGDALYVTQSGGTVEYQGIVQYVGMDEVTLGFGPRFKEAFIPRMQFKIRFQFNRSPLRLAHRACELAVEDSLEPTLFPTPDNVAAFKPFLDLDLNLRWYSHNPSPNPEQERAIRHILLGTSRPAPYIVYGPPGTGKTFTIVEAIKQIVCHLPNACILACTPSNSAADLITKRLLTHIPKSKILRFNAASRSYLTVDPAIKEVCNYDDSDLVYFPSLDEIMKYKIVVSTLVTSGRLASAKFPCGHFTHVIIDEAGHATEPETIIGVAGLLDINPHVQGGQLVLAGDPQQLGPVLRSRMAVQYRLNVSLLERLMLSQDIYQRQEAEAMKDGNMQPYDPRCITKLVKNYRSHPAIMSVSNKCFYDDELEFQADEVMRNQFCKWHGLPVQDFPVIFHALTGKDRREAHSPSFFNAEEVSVVMGYVDEFLGKKAKGLKQFKPTDIGIISPYQKQVQKIRIVLGSKGLKAVKVGSVEEFQGQESLITIVSTVRSQPEYLALDMKFSLGFLNNFKRFNVAVSRAKALLIVIGNPNMLMMDPYWEKFIRWCHVNGSIKNPKLMPDMDAESEQELEDVLGRFSTMQLIGGSESESEADSSELEELEAASQFSEVPWRAEV